MRFVDEGEKSIGQDQARAQAMNRPESRKPVKRSDTAEWTERLRSVMEAVTLCPADIVARKELALLLEELGEMAGALFHWRRILDHDPNHLDAWEGMARCRDELGQPLPPEDERATKEHTE